jgi:hypothetical protein
MIDFPAVLAFWRTQQRVHQHYPESPCDRLVHIWEDLKHLWPFAVDTEIYLPSAELQWPFSAVCRVCICFISIRVHVGKNSGDRRADWDCTRLSSSFVKITVIALTTRIATLNFTQYYANVLVSLWAILSVSDKIITHFLPWCKSSHFYDTFTRFPMVSAVGRLTGSCVWRQTCYPIGTVIKLAILVVKAMTVIFTNEEDSRVQSQSARLSPEFLPTCTLMEMKQIQTRHTAENGHWSSAEGK